MWRFQVFRVRLWSVMWSKKACRSAQLTLTDKPFLFSEGQGRKKLPRCNHKRDALRLCCNLSGRELCFLCMPAVSRRKNQKDSKNTRSRCSSRRGIPQYGCGFDIGAAEWAIRIFNALQQNVRRHAANVGIWNLYRG